MIINAYLLFQYALLQVQPDNFTISTKDELRSRVCTLGLEEDPVSVG